MSDNRLEAACALAFRDSMREQGPHITTADASQYSIAFHAAAEAVADHLSGREAVTFRQETAVIEAAKALGIIRLLADARDGRDFTTEQCRALRDFEGAVAALQEVEGGND